MNFYERINYLNNLQEYTFTEATAPNTTIIKDNLYPKVASVLSTKVGDAKFKQLIGAFVDRNSYKLHTPGPLYPIVFMNEKKDFFDLFNITEHEVKDYVVQITKAINEKSSFTYLTNNPIFWVFYCAIRYYTLKKDKIGLNTSLLMYTIAVYPSVFNMSYKYPPNEGVMQYTIDHLSEKFTIKKAGSLMNALYQSITSSYAFLSQFIEEGTDGEAIRFIQRIHNDQKSMIKNITDEYMKNYRLGNRVISSLDSNGDFIDDTKENDTTVVEQTANKVITPIISAGFNMQLAKKANLIAQVSLADTRYYVSKVLNEHTDSIRPFVEAILFRFLYDDHKTRADINTSYFLNWAAQLFRQTNSKNPNIRTIKETLDLWAEKTGIHDKFKRDASRTNYKKALFMYFIFAIQYYNQ